MPRGIAFDRYDVPQGGLPGAPGLGRAPADTSVADALTGAARIAQGFANRAVESKAKAELLQERVLVGERYLTASEEMDRKLIEIEKDPASRGKAESIFQEWVEQRKGAWSRDLSPTSAADLQERLITKRAAGGHQSRVMQVRDLQDRAQVVIRGNGRAYQEDFVRSAPLDAAPGTVPPAIGPDPYNILKQSYADAVAAGAMSRAEADKGLASDVEEAAATKAHSMLLGRRPNEIARLQELLKQEEAKPGTTFLQALKPERRAAIEKMAKDEDYTLLQRQQANTDREHRLQKEKLAEDTQEFLRRADTRLKDGTLDNAYIEDGKRYGLVDDDKARFYRTAMEKRATGEDSPNDAPTFRRLAESVFSQSNDPTVIKAQVEKAFSDGRINYRTANAWIGTLDERVRYNTTRGTTERDKEIDQGRRDVEEFIKISTTTRSMFEKIDPQAQALRLKWLERLSAVPRTEDARHWYQASKAEFLSQMDDLARTTIRTERALMLNPQFVDARDIARNEQAYKARYGDRWNDMMLEDIRRITDVNALEFEMASKKGDGKPGPKPGASPTPAAKPANGGPLRSGSRR